MALLKVIILGGGFGGINAAKGLRKADVDVLVIDKTNHHVFQPLLYQVASAALSPGNIAVPIREVLQHQSNTSVIMANATKINLQQKKVQVQNGEEFSYDYLILAPGASHSYFGHDQWETYAPGLKTIADAIRIREKILFAFEMAERSDNLEQRESYLRFIIIGGGPTGVEMAGAIAEISRKTMFKNFRKIKPEQSEIYLIEGMPQILPSYPLSLARIAQKDLEKLGVKVLTSTFVTEIAENGVFLGSQFLSTMNVIWAAGNRASPLLQTLQIPLDKQGRALVGSDLSVPGHPEVFVIGDAAYCEDKKGNPLPAIAPVAIQQAAYVAKIIKKKSAKRVPFRYFDKGTMATIGKEKAVAVVGKLKLSGRIAWWAWCFIHILYLISFRNRVIVLTQWFFWYLTGKRPVRLITRPIETLKK